jgi:hypothetical protein
VPRVPQGGRMAGEADRDSTDLGRLLE